ncbi:MAG: LPS export ABC transporter ATP-binding protein [Candidatus Goldiibacteriota bacterium HGW-Goldbacteria-1]|jgi:lipopolysaccharide export system ATP-binding protein|nr:MAG: LPS export ABC transporter ATP-binding protein [Candidatus Goldiibacteriota bacterium HGW-Goldbacteria-1]
MKHLKTEHLVKTYNKKRVVNDVCVDVKQGEIVGLLGPNGAGKTTTFYMVLGVIQPDAGGIFLDDKDGGRMNLTGMPMYKRALNGISYLSQEPSIFRRLTVEENIMSVLEFMDMPQADKKHRLEQLLEEFKISHLAKQKAYTLSGGERRRTEIARSLVLSPSFILLDEPFVGIDPIAVFDIQNIIRELKKKNIGILITDHNVRETLSITDRAYILYEGKILLHGPADQLAHDKKAREIYLGEKFTL